MFSTGFLDYLTFLQQLDNINTEKRYGKIHSTYCIEQQQWTQSTCKQHVSWSLQPCLLPPCSCPATHSIHTQHSEEWGMKNSTSLSRELRTADALMQHLKQSDTSRGKIIQLGGPRKHLHLGNRKENYWSKLRCRPRYYLAQQKILPTFTSFLYYAPWLFIC